MKVEHITIAGMILTIVLSLGGSYGSYLVNAAEQSVQLETLTLESKEHKAANKIAYKLEAEMEHNQRMDARQQLELDKYGKKIEEDRISAARREEALNTLIIATKDLTQTTNQLVIQVTKLSK